jgi:hypothetical protein
MNSVVIMNNAKRKRTSVSCVLKEWDYTLICYVVILSDAASIVRSLFNV